MADYPEINVPATPEEAARIKAADLSWTGPKLIALLFVTMGIVLAVLYAGATASFDPTMGQ